MKLHDIKQHLPGLQYWAYDLPDGWTVLAGKTDQDNDLLSLRVAHPKDFWFHVRGMPGSHVVLRAPEQGLDPDADVLKVAAAIAAWHSKARSGGRVGVTCARAGDVSKPRGCEPGQVQVRKEKVIKVKPALPAEADCNH